MRVGRFWKQRVGVQRLKLEGSVAIDLATSAARPGNCKAKSRRPGMRTSWFMARTGIFRYVRANADVRTGRGIIEGTMTNAGLLVNACK